MQLQMASEYELPYCIHGYHTYNHISDAGIGEILTCQREPTNENNRFSVSRF